MTSEHLKTGQDYDAALIWTEDVSRSSFQVCLRELQNFDGKHEDISVVCVRSKKLEACLLLLNGKGDLENNFFHEKLSP